MTEQFDLDRVLKFVRGLKRNNHREWFQAHRAEYESARAEFEGFVAALIGELSRTQRLGNLDPKDCIFRMNRDLRFTKDKTLYKPYMSAHIAPGGRNASRLGYYVHLEAGNHSILAGGLHEPEPQQLAAWRQAIDRDPLPFKKIASAAAFRKYFGAVRGERLKAAPRGFAKEHPELELLQLKQVLVWREVRDKQVVSDHFLRDTLDTHKAMRPFLAYLQALA